MELNPGTETYKEQLQLNAFFVTRIRELEKAQELRAETIRKQRVEISNLNNEVAMLNGTIDDLRSALSLENANHWLL